MEDEEYSLIFKMILIGDSGVGKSNILSRYINNSFSETTRSTVGVELSAKVEEINNTKIKIQIWDTAGQERYKSITKTYYKGAKGALIVYDITNKESFKNVDKWINDLKESGDDDVSILIVGNKCDLEASREVTTDEVKKKAELYKMAYCETSALKGENIDNAFRTLIKIVVEKNEKKKNEEDKYGNKSNVISTGVTLETKIISEEKRPKNKYGKCC
jgi:small GTP-binding protein